MLDRRNQNKVALQSLVGHVEWVYTLPTSGRLEIVFRCDGVLYGLCFYERETGVLYSQHSKRPGYTEMVAEPLGREAVIKGVAYVEFTKERAEPLFTEAERQEWEAICKQSEEKRLRREKEQERQQEEAERREYERLRSRFQDSK